MDIEGLNKKRNILHQLMKQSDEFFTSFGEVDDKAFAGGAIPKKYKELTCLAISVLLRCEECILYHMQECLKEGSSKKEVIEAIKMGMMGGGSFTYPYVRFAFAALKELSVL